MIILFFDNTKKTHSCITNKIVLKNGNNGFDGMNNISNAGNVRSINHRCGHRVACEAGKRKKVSRSFYYF